jgi:ABC-type branched-subunit amino acid transport system permease subunit
MDEYVDGATAYLQANPLVAGAIGLVVLYLLFRQTKLLLFLLVTAGILGVVFWLITDLAGKGGTTKSRMINQTGVQDTK